MKITKTQLKQNIKEELERIVEIASYPDKKLMIALAGLDTAGLETKAKEIKKWFGSAENWYAVQDYYSGQDSNTRLSAYNDLLQYLDIQEYDEEKKQLIKGIGGL